MVNSAKSAVFCLEQIFAVSGMEAASVFMWYQIADDSYNSVCYRHTYINNSQIAVPFFSDYCICCFYERFNITAIHIRKTEHTYIVKLSWFGMYIHNDKSLCLLKFIKVYYLPLIIYACCSACFETVESDVSPSLSSDNLNDLDPGCFWH